MKKSVLTLVLILAFLAAACPPPTHYVWVDICSVSGLLPTKWCPEVVNRQFTLGQQPTIPCQLHKEPTVRVCDETGRTAAVSCPATHEVPVSERPTFYCMRHARNALVRPWLILGWLDGQSKVQRMTDEELDSACRRIGEAGVRWVRIFYPGWEDGQECILPYVKNADGKFDLTKPNYAYDTNLQRLALALQKYEVGLLIDMADQCGWGDSWDCWRVNANAIYGWQETTPEALRFWRLAVERVLNDIGGIEGNHIGLGNELRHIADGDLVGSCEWALEWAGHQRVDYLVSLGMPRPVTFSGCCNTAHKIIGCVSSEDGYYPDNFFVCQVLHGIGWTGQTVEGKTVDEWLDGISVTRPFGYSNDGTNVPKEVAGTCDQMNGCSANTAEQIALIRLFERHIDEGRFRVIEYMPREIAFDEGLDKVKQVSLDMFWQTGLQVFGVDPRRTF